MKSNKVVTIFPSVDDLTLPDDWLSGNSIQSRPVNTPHQLELRRKLAKRTRRGVFYLGPIPEEWAVACHNAHSAGYLLACAIRARFTMNEGVPVSVSQTLADRLGISSDARKRALAALEAAGLVQVERKPGCAPLATMLPWTPPKAK